MTDTNMLKSKIIQKGLTSTQLAKKLNMSKATFSMKVNNKIKFSQNDIKNIVDILNLNDDEIRLFFLN